MKRRGFLASVLGVLAAPFCGWGAGGDAEQTKFEMKPALYGRLPSNDGLVAVPFCIDGKFGQVVIDRPGFECLKRSGRLHDTILRIALQDRGNDK